MPTNAGEMTQSPPGDPQWVLCDGKYHHGYATAKPNFPDRPKAGISRGNVRDYHRRVQGWAGSRGIGGFLMRVPYDPTGTWYISRADDSSETTLTNPPTPQHPPAGVR